MMIPIAAAIASQGQYELLPLAYAVTIAASAGFATPFGYATNLMVYAPGGYRFTDYLKVGIPLDIIVGAVAVMMIHFLFF